MVNGQVQCNYGRILRIHVCFELLDKNEPELLKLKLQTGLNDQCEWEYPRSFHPTIKNILFR
eukprot:11405746-Ditylum_brightwellii.AAC.1